MKTPSDIKHALTKGLSTGYRNTKTYKVQTEIDEPKRTATFICSFETLDRDNEVIQIAGIDTKNYETNPIFAFNHITQGVDGLPIGKCIHFEKTDKALIATFEFVPYSNPIVGNKSQGIFELVKDGFLSAVSIGYEPKLGVWLDDEQTLFSFTEVELLEISVVTVPANPYALVLDVTDVNEAPAPVVTETVEDIQPEEIEPKKSVRLDYAKKFLDLINIKSK